METRQQFINRMHWMVAEINSSKKGNALDIISMIDFNMIEREKLIRKDEIKKLQLYIYRNFKSLSKAKILLHFIDIFIKKSIM